MNWKRFFVKQKKIEKSRVRVEKLIHWLELQFKPIISPLNEQITQFEKKKEQAITEAKQLAQEIEQTIEKKKIKHTTIFNHAQVYIRALGQFSQTQDITHLTKAKSQVGHTLEQTMRGQYTKANSIIDTFTKSTQQIEQIKELPEYIAQKHCIQAANNYLEQLKQIEQLNKALKDLQEQKQAILVKKQKYEHRVNTLSSDPRRKMELDNRFQSKFRHSFYELELMDFQSKIEQCQTQIKTLEKKRVYIDSHKEKIHPQTQLQIINKELAKQFSMEVEIVGNLERIAKV
ncbi:MAG: hypothetical protein ACMXYF_02020 [Candidatus Woesearchaeota archaeon]